MDIPIAEFIPKTIQGEGLFIGTVVSIIRLYGCNLSCKWCDTSWARGDKPSFNTDSVESLIKESLSDVVITGGEPTISPYFEYLVERLSKANKRVHVETNGTNLKEHWLLLPRVYWAISPKLRTSGNIQNLAQYVPIWNRFLCNSSSFMKFVISDPSMDFAEIFNLMNKEELVFPYGKLFFQPVSNDLEIFKEMMKTGPDFGRYTLQLHKLVGVR